MKEVWCGALLQFLPSSAEVDDFFSSFIANCVLNAFLSYTNIMLNILTIHAMRKTSSLLEPRLKALLLSLAISDLGVGLLGQPFYIALLIMASQQQDPTCATNTVYVIILNAFCAASFLTIMALSVDRFMAIQLHLRYQELVTRKRVVAVVISIWVLCVTFYPLAFTLLHPNIVHFIVVAIGTACLLVASVVSLKIYLVVRRHKRQIQAQLQQLARNGELANIASLRKSAVSIFYMYLVFLICYLPQFCTLTFIIIHGQTMAAKQLLTFTLTVVFLKSSLNPVICFWKIKHIRRNVIITLRNIFPSRN